MEMEQMTALGTHKGEMCNQGLALFAECPSRRSPWPRPLHA